MCGQVLIQGLVNYKIVVGGTNESDVGVVVTLYDSNNKIITEHNDKNGQLSVANANLWWPVGMNETSVGYLYTLKVITVYVCLLIFWTSELQYEWKLFKVTLVSLNDSNADVYRLPVGIRTVKTTKYGIFINDVSFYFKGCGMHEDADVHNFHSCFKVC